jgi:hypothetical protein
VRLVRRVTLPGLTGVFLQTSEVEGKGMPFSRSSCFAFASSSLSRWFEARRGALYQSSAWSHWSRSSEGLNG